jgi:hypothetical protein
MTKSTIESKKTFTNAKTFFNSVCFLCGVDLSFHSWRGPGEIRDFAFLEQQAIIISLLFDEIKQVESVE